MSSSRVTAVVCLVLAVSVLQQHVSAGRHGRVDIHIAQFLHAQTRLQHHIHKQQLAEATAANMQSQQAQQQQHTQAHLETASLSHRLPVSQPGPACSGMLCSTQALARRALLQFGIPTGTFTPFGFGRFTGNGIYGACMQACNDAVCSCHEPHAPPCVHAMCVHDLHYLSLPIQLHHAPPLIAAVHSYPYCVESLSA